GRGFPLQHESRIDGNLRLIEAPSSGPLSSLVLDYAFKHPEKPYISLAQVQTKHHEKLSIAYWHGGIALLPEDQNELRPLATFPEPLLINTHDDICAKIAPITIGVKDFPQGGKAIISAVHPEVFGDYLEPYTRHMALQKENSHYRALQEPYRATAEILKENQEGLYCLFKDI